MNTNLLMDSCGFMRLTDADPREIDGAFAGDLLSWAMSRVGLGNVWFTVMGNINAVAVASLSDCACIVLCHGAPLAEDAQQRATQEGIVILGTELPVYEAVTKFNEVSRLAL